MSDPKKDEDKRRKKKRKKQIGMTVIDAEDREWNNHEGAREEESDLDFMLDARQWAHKIIVEASAWPPDSAVQPVHPPTGVPKKSD